MSRRYSCLVLLGLVLALVAPGLTGTAPQAIGQPLIWTGSQDITWSNTNGSLNWTMSGVPSTDNGGNAVIFDDSAGTSFSIAVDPAGVLPLSVQFNNVNYAYSFSGGAIGGAATTVTLGTLGQPGGSVTFLSANSYGGGTFVESGTLSLGNGAALGVGGLTANGGVVSLAGVSPAALPSLNGLAGTITDSASSAVTLTVSPNATSTFGGVLQNGAGTLALAVNGGTFPLVLSNANTYSGGTTISAGTLQLGNGVSNGSVAGNIADNGLLAFNNAAAQTFGGLISGSGSLLQSGPSTLVLSNLANSYSGGTTVTGGTLLIATGGTISSTAGNSVLGSGGTLALNGGALSFTSSPTISRAIVLGASGGTVNVPFIDTQSPQNSPATTVRLTGQITGAGGLTVTGGSGSNYGGAINNLAPYILVINGLTNSYSGNTTINNALVCPDSTDNPPVNILPTTTVLTLANSGVFALQTSGAAQTLAGLQGDSTTALGTMNGNATSTVTYTINPAAGQSYTYAGTISDVEFNGRGNATGNASLIDVVIGGQGAEVLSGANPYNGTTTINSGTLGLTGSLTATAITVSGGTLNEGASGLVGGSASLAVSSGLALLAGVNTYSGATTLSGGTLELANVNALANGVVTNNVPSGGLTFAAGLGTATIGGLSGSGNIALADISGGRVTLNFNGNNTTTYSGALSGIGGLTNTGGVLTLTNSLSNYSGPTSITGGAFVLGNTGVLPLFWTTSGAFSISNTGAFGITAGTAAGEFTAANITTLLSNVTFPAGTSLGIQVVDPSPYTLSNSLSGAMGLNKLGAGNLLIVGSSNTYTGPTTISAGTLQLGNGVTNGSLASNTTITDNGVLAFANSTAQTYSGVIGGTGALAALGPGLLAITNSFNGTTSVSAGTLQLVNAGALGSLSGGGGNVTFNAPTLIAGGNNGSTTFAGAISGSGGFTKAGAGTMLITNSQTYSGATTISSGVLKLGPAGVPVAIADVGSTLANGTGQNTSASYTNSFTIGAAADVLVVELAWHNNNSASVNPVVKYGPAGAPPSGTLTEVASAFNNGLGNVGSNENTAIFILPQGASGYAVGAGSLSVNFGTGTQNYDAVIDAFTLSGVRAIARI